jgi:Skp family chaperone for outer membrane proteins
MKFLLLACLLFASGCSSTGIAIREQFGYAKREQLVNRVSDARDSQTAAKAQFESALAEFLAVAGSSDAKTSELEARYKSLRTEYDRSESRASTVRSRITDVENVASALFKEWQGELSQYSSAERRAISERQLRDTKAQYEKLLGVMKEASSRMDPVLAAFKDQVLALKHSLNAAAIASLRGEAGRIQSDVSDLIKQMQAAVDEADAFIRQMHSGE